MNILEKFLVGPVADIVSSGVTNCSPDDILAGSIDVLDMPYLTWREPGRFLQIMFKLITQRAVLRRAGWDRPVLVWMDDAQLFLTEEDVEVQTVARQSGLINFLITQSIPVMQEAFGGGPRAEQQVNAILGQMQTKFICQQGCPVSNEAMSRLLGTSRQTLMSGSAPTGHYDAIGDMFDIPPEQSGSAGFSEQWLPEVQPHVFTQLAKGGADYGRIVEAICFQGGRTWRNGKRWVRCQFRQ